MRRWLFIAPLLVVVALAAVFYALLMDDKDPSEIPSALIDRPVPAFTLPGLGSSPGLSSGDLKGEVTLVNVFASWCVPCRAEHPVLTELAKEKRVRLVGINYKDKPEAALKWLDDLGNPYERIGADAQGRVAIEWGVYGVPETFVVDRQGVIRYKHVGPVTPEILSKTLLPIIEALRKA